jgi:hypothetical protein
MRQAIEKVLASMVVVSGMALVHPAAADQGATDTPSQDEPGRSTARVVTLSASVQKIDKSNRMVTLKGTDGDETDVKVGADVNLDRLHKGDMVTATYFQEVAVALRKSDTSSPKVTKKTVERGGVTAEQTTVTAKVLSVEPDQNKVVVEGPQNKLHTLTVQDPDIQAQLGKIKKGDNVALTYTQAMAVSVEPNKK